MTAAEIPSSELLERLRAHKAELLGLLTGDACRRCGKPMGWPEPRGVVYADGTAKHHTCRVWAAAARVTAGVVGTSDDEELITGEEQPR